MTLSLGFVFKYEQDAFKILEEIPRPDVFVTNSRLLHMIKNIEEFEMAFNNSERQYWKNVFPSLNIPLPRYRFFQNGKELQGKRSHQFEHTYHSNLVRQTSEIARKFYVEEMGFMELNEYMLTLGRYPHSSDGWHFSGTPRLMEVITFFNMLCNDWYSKEHNVRNSSRPVM